MATIEMDISEYESMKKVEALLEKSLAKEELLNAKVAKLREEKIVALEKNDKSVTIIEKKFTQEMVYSNYTFRQVLDRIQRHMDMKRTKRRHSSDTEDNRMIELLFEKKVQEFETDKSVTRKGLDEEIKTIREELQANLSKETVEKFRELEDLRAKYKDSFDIIALRNESLVRLEDEARMLQQTNEKFIETNDKLMIRHEIVSITFDGIVDILNLMSVWNIKNGVKKIKLLIKKYQDGMGQ